ncbi:glycosyltransferase family 9 protein [Aquariibacter albus]|uniref:Glycosyltransferase family 9 protein n=1 Tax=Aquariibacter albus TaxID=2759899 RepID=A0A839HGF9_9BURK|nr:glycosyltransferase family 9 protein [Aquariibacter albus]MBB1160673.1 glycosyltransferase family 9 protein [Aquariibacter albus]
MPCTAAVPARILVIRLSALGDVIMASGLLPALRAIHPRAEISWLVEPAALPLLSGHPRLDHVIVWPRGEWRRLWQERRYGAWLKGFLQLRRQLKDGRFDLVLDTQGLLKSAVWGWLSGAPRRISLIGWEGSHHLATERLVPPEADARRRFGAEYRALAEYLGAPADTFRPDLVPSEAATLAADRALASAARLAGADPALPRVVFCPWTTRPQKHWFEDRWVELARLVRARGMLPVVLGGPADRAASEQLVAQATGTLQLAGHLPLDASLAVISQAKLLIGVDTGLTHAGTALHIPTVALFGSTRPYLDAGSPTTVVLHSGRACSPCRRRPSCGGRFDCMRDLDLAQVWRAAETVLAAAQPGTELSL